MIKIEKIARTIARKTLEKFNDIKRDIAKEKKRLVLPPPHIIKQQTIKNFGRKFRLEVLIETGTYYGDMVETMKNYFSQIYSIELSKELYEKAKEKFVREKKIKIIHGDSGVELKKLLSNIKEPVLFWLDGHYSGGITAQGDKDTPIYEELNHIFNANLEKYVIIIDDARLFGDSNYPDYPSIKELIGFVKTNISDVKIKVKDDMIRIIPKK